MRNKDRALEDGFSGAAVFLADMVEFWYNTSGCLFLPWQQGGGEEMATFVDFIVAVAANVLGVFICKWFDRHSRGN